MKATREEQKVEALERMKKWGIIRDAIKQFKDEDRVMRSEGGILFWLDEGQKKAVKEFEEQYGGLVYAVIWNNTEFGELLSMLYVGNEKDHWEQDKDDIKDGYAFAYVKNLDDPTCSEYGTIGVKARYGGLVRTA